MTISSQVRKAGPFVGNDSATVFPFAFKVFAASDLLVVLTVIAADLDTNLALTTDYTVNLNVDQNANPGGSVVLPAALATGYLLTITSSLPYLQPTDLTNQGGFYPAVITNALDRLTIFVQQLVEQVNRSLKLSITTSADVSTTLPSPAANALLGWNSTADALENVDAGTLATIVAFGTANADIFSGNGVTTVFALTDNPGGINNLDVAIGGVTQTPGVDYTWVSGTALTFTSPPPSGTGNVLVRYMRGLPLGYTSADLVSYGGGGTVEEALDTSLQVVPTFGALSSTVATIGQQVSVPGVGIFDVVSSSGLTPNTGTKAVNGAIGFVRTTIQPVSPRTFGAAGDSVTDDTAELQNAITNAPLVSFVEGDYRLLESGASGYAVLVPANVALKGAGGKIKVEGMGFYGFASFGASNVSVSDMLIRGVGHVGNDAGSTAVWMSGETADAWNLCLSFSSIVDSSWGALVRCEVGSGVARNVRFIGNDVHSTSANTMADGLHIVGKVECAVVAANTVKNRGDAGIAVNATATHNGYGFAVTGNASVDNLVGVDVSGASYGVVVGNVCYSTIDHAASNPALRGITYSGRTPSYLIFGNNVALGTHTTSGEVDVKLTTAGADVYAHVNNNMLRTFYTDSRHVSFCSNYFAGNGVATFDNNSGEIHIGSNTWSGAMDIRGQGNPGLAGNVSLKKQNWTRWTPANFLPTYSAANPFWEGKWFLDSDTRLVSNESFVTSSAVPVDVTNGVLNLRFPCILDAIIAVADCATHSGHISLTNMANVEMARVDFSVSPGVGGTNVVSSAFTFPTSGGAPYKPKLAAGVYKMRAYSDVNALTIKTISVAIWD